MRFHENGAKGVHFVDLGESFPTSILNIRFETDSYSNEYLLAKFGSESSGGSQ